MEYILLVVFSSLRFGSMFAAMPVFGVGPMPMQVKIFIPLAFGVMMLPFHNIASLSGFVAPGVFLLTVMKEVLVGLFLGFSARMLFLIVSTAFEVAGLQMGFAIANIFDPANNMQISVLGQLTVVLVILFLLGINWHHDMFRVLVKSYQVVPIGPESLDIGHMVGRLVGFLKVAFEMALRIALPVIITMLTVHVMMGVISRTAPQMNLFFNVAFVVNIAAGLMLVWLTYPRLIVHIQRVADSMLRKGYGLL